MPKALPQCTTPSQIAPYTLRSQSTARTTRSSIVQPRDSLDTKTPPKKKKDARGRGKDSHLYTDDNPRTTLHGTGFKDAETAHHTISMIANRSITYQWQVVNTMYYRAAHHPSRQSSAGMQHAMTIFRDWLHVTYPEAKRKRREFKPLLKRETVQRFLPRIEKHVDAGLANVYVALPKGKRLANVLAEDENPAGLDWEVLREKELAALVDQRADRHERGDDGLWVETTGNGGKTDVSVWHLQCIAWAWSPVAEARLPR